MASGAWKYTMHVTVHLPPPLVIHSPQPTHCRACCYMQDLIQNHLTMALYNHAAIWAGRPDRMPRAFYTNGHLCIARMVEGKVGDGVASGVGQCCCFAYLASPVPLAALPSHYTARSGEDVEIQGQLHPAEGCCRALGR